MELLLQSDVLDRLQADSGPTDPVRDLVLAAVLGEVEEALGGKTLSRPEVAPAEIPKPVRAYVASIAVEGFRGIGPKAELALTPGPGLTLVVGRNGSGKSSFAEALELVLTGDNRRWSGRNKIWKEGWRNLHWPEGTTLEAALLIDAEAGKRVVSRSWDAKAALEAGVPSPSLAELGWDQPLSVYRPFLSYNELGSMLEEGPSKLFDALASILGLEDLVAAAEALKKARTSRTEAHKAVKNKLKDITSSLAAHPDERARKCLEALSGKKWDLDAVEELVSTGGAAEDASEIGRLRQLASLPGPSLEKIQEAASGLRSAVEATKALAGTDAEKARRRADVLERALEIHRHDGDGDCPVCGKTEALDEAWHLQAEEEVRSLRKEAEAAELAYRLLRDAEQKARALLSPLPSVLPGSSPARALWISWSEGASKAGHALAEHLESGHEKLGSALWTLRADARKELESKEDLWRPRALELASWILGARKMLAETETLGRIKDAEDWIRATVTEIHNERFLPIKEKVKATWALLRTQSHVELEDVTFEGKATARRVNLEVTVDGTEGAALGVMSQGELHSLALSLFLPRATLEVSPFRFVVIDDPVQSMDPARVDGLARVLDSVGRDRQVLVFTHDDRLPEAVRRLGIGARIVEVLRREGSVVELRNVRSPARQYLEDAFALVRDTNVPGIVVERVVPGLCRQSLEAVAVEVVRRRRLQRGDSHEEVEALWNTHTKLLPRLALVLFDDAGKAGDVLGRIDNGFGKRQADAVRACNEGAHKGILVGDALDLVRTVEKLLEKLSATK
jgi:ABC-type Mn2+/Zn2+ transport system ATPase subunit